MPTFNVRCCCSPQKVFGTLDLPSSDRVQVIQVRDKVGRLVGVEQIRLEEALFCHRATPEELALISYPPSHVETTAELAVYSDDRPIEFWRRVAGFKETI